MRACTVHLDGAPTVLGAGVGGGQDRSTLAGLGTPEKPHPLQALHRRRCLWAIAQQLDHDRGGAAARSTSGSRSATGSPGSNAAAGRAASCAPSDAQRRQQ
jgi:hypothetical protein